MGARLERDPMADGDENFLFTVPLCQPVHEGQEAMSEVRKTFPLRMTSLMLSVPPGLLNPLVTLPAPCVAPGSTAVLRNRQHRTRAGHR
jgi:hypothetical protein